ncbi:hypothetical protein EDD36DRAFT_419828 [Exophiala viscosa]|uniref:Uncharacterized protein n=1 Tax=Exophiala viscosa TaxID=2486360 RepID=A0AAN6DTR2_9EURO|nr:hypothetical protein EDD36DRAFT_419828 [Exophiala viscosa]
METPGQDPAGGQDQVFVAQDVHVNHDFESQPLEDVREELADEISDDEEDESLASEGEVSASTIREFMRSPEQSDVNLPEADAVGEYCDSADLDLLRASPPFEPKDGSENINIWFDDRKWIDGKKGFKQSRWYTPTTGTGSGSPANRNDTESESAEAPTTPASAHVTDQGQGEKPKWAWTDRSYRYIHDPDRWSICALIGSVAYYRPPGLRLALYRHFASRTSIDVSPSSGCGFPTFQLAFSLPYWAWRSSKQPVPDNRKTKHGQPLREYRDISLFGGPGQGQERSFIYEAQITCVVTGLVDKFEWTVYCFHDTRHDGKSAQNAYQHSKDVKAGVLTDPIAFGMIDANIPIHSPSEYFIRILVIRLKLIKDEWTTIVHKMRSSIRKYDSRWVVLPQHLLEVFPTRSNPLANLKSQEHFPLSQDHLRCRPGDHGESQQSKVDDALTLVLSVKSVVTRLLGDLTKTVDACDGFHDTFVPEFLKVPDTSHRNRLLYELPETYRELRTLGKELEFLVQRVDEFARELEFRLNLQMHQTGSLHRALTEASNEMARNNGALTTIMLRSRLPEAKETDVHRVQLFCSPIALAAGIFSMDQDVIRSVPRSFAAFTVLTVVLGIFGLIFRYWPHLNDSWQKRLAATKSLRSGTRARSQKILVEMFHVLCHPINLWKSSIEAMYTELFRFSRRHPRNAQQSQTVSGDMSLPFWRASVKGQRTSDQPFDVEAEFQQQAVEDLALSDIENSRHIVRQGNFNES